MPPKTEKGRREAAEVAAFVRELYEGSTFESWGEFGRAAGLSASTMSDYKRAENAPDGYRLLKLIRAAGWKEAQAPDQLDRRLEAIEKAVLQVDEALLEVAANQERGLTLVERLTASPRTATGQSTASADLPAANTTL